MAEAINFCTNCGAKVERRVPDGDILPRYTCPVCQHIHYQNPKVVVGSVAEWQGRVLLCRRAIEPRRGFWTLPAGFLENQETTAQGAARETLEEALSPTHDAVLFSLMNVPHIDQIHMFYRAKLASDSAGVGAETLETQLLAEHEIDWPQLAFPTVYHTLRCYFADSAKGEFGFHTRDVETADWRVLASQPAPMAG